MNDVDYSYLSDKLVNLLDLDLSHYKTTQMYRRLDSFIGRYNLPDIASYCELLENDKDAVVKLHDFLTINVSEFFRDTQHFNILCEQILPELLKYNHSLNIWSAGCSNGAEAYSVAIALESLAPYREHSIVGIDIDNHSLAIARAGGPYKGNEVKNIPAPLIKKCFVKDDNSYVLNPRIKSRVRFIKGDLLKASYNQVFDLILCRNVMIYFTAEAKRLLNRNFYHALKQNGILFIGGTETIFEAVEIGFRRLYPCFYTKD